MRSLEHNSGDAAVMSKCRSGFDDLIPLVSFRVIISENYSDIRLSFYT